MDKSKTWICIALIAISIMHVGCSDSPGIKLTETAVSVQTKFVSNYDIDQTFSYSGTIEESESTPLSFSVPGSVLRVLVSEGDYVKRGQLLAELNDATFKSAYQISIATLKQAEDAYNRLLPMYKNGNLPEIKLVEVETGLHQAKASEEISKKNLTDCKLYSPVDGIVGKRSIEPGMNAMPGLNSITIVKIEKVFARVPISENEISSIKKGDRAQIKIAALNNSWFTGTVEEIGVMADPLARTYKIKIGIVNNAHQIKPGMICSVVLEKPTTLKGLFIPSSAVLVDEQGRNFVYVVNQNKAVKKYVTTGKLLKSGVEVTEGLNDGEQVVVAGLQKLVDNSLIRIVNQ